MRLQRYKGGKLPRKPSMYVEIRLLQERQRA
jgi:hypothetical protein